MWDEVFWKFFTEEGYFLENAWNQVKIKLYDLNYVKSNWVENDDYYV